MLPPSPPWCLAVRAGQIIVERHAVNLEQFVETADKADAADKAEKSAEKARTSGEVKISHRVGIVPGNTQQRDSSASSLTLGSGVQSVIVLSTLYTYSMVLWFGSCRAVLWLLLGTTMCSGCPHLSSFVFFQ